MRKKDSVFLVESFFVVHFILVKMAQTISGISQNPCVNTIATMLSRIRMNVLNFIASFLS